MSEFLLYALLIMNKISYKNKSASVLFITRVLQYFIGRNVMS
jgi:hypothetical protein